ncbi:hypothetical protein CHS00_004942 [Salmonella enterica subsp. enterica serovar Saintpaul]|nr:hypothetical protein [Salmonella enterica subsp. enterica serovar Saintpaul]
MQQCHIWCPLSSQEFQDLPDGAETTLTLIGSTVDGHHFCNISCFPFAPEALGTV